MRIRFRSHRGAPVADIGTYLRLRIIVRTLRPTKRRVVIGSLVASSLLFAIAALAETYTVSDPVLNIPLVSVGTTPSDNPNGWVAVANGGNASSLIGVSNGGNASGLVGVSTGSSSGIIAIGGTGCASQAAGLAISATGCASSGSFLLNPAIAISGTGSATANGGGDFIVVRALAVAISGTNSAYAYGGPAISGEGSASSDTAAVSGTNTATGYIAISGIGPATGANAASGTGNANGSVLAFSGIGNANGYYAVSGTGCAYGTVAISSQCGISIPGSTIGDPYGFTAVGTTSSDNPQASFLAVGNGGTASSDGCIYPIGCSIGNSINTTGAAYGGTDAISGTGNAYGSYAISGTGNAYGGFVSISGTGTASGGSALNVSGGEKKVTAAGITVIDDDDVKVDPYPSVRCLPHTDGYQGGLLALVLGGSVGSASWGDGSLYVGDSRWIGVGGPPSYVNGSIRADTCYISNSVAFWYNDASTNLSKFIPAGSFATDGFTFARLDYVSPDFEIHVVWSKVPGLGDINPGSDPGDSNPYFDFNAGFGRCANANDGSLILPETHTFLYEDQYADGASVQGSVRGFGGNPTAVKLLNASGYMYTHSNNLVCTQRAPGF
jgi:hypothetical protein